MKDLIRKTLKKILPPKIFEYVKSFYVFIQKKTRKVRVRTTLIFVKQQHAKRLKELRDKDIINVAFFAVESSVWKYDLFFKMLLENKRFNPYVVVCPYVVYGDAHMRFVMKNAYEYFLAKGYTTYKTYDDSSNSWLDIKNKLRPDIVFFTNPYNSLTKKQYTISNFLDTLTYYAPYGFQISHSHEAHYNQDMHNFVWKYFLETRHHQKLSRTYAINKGYNTIVSGYPGIDDFLCIRGENKRNQAAWKPQANKRKRIIWAPHHTIPGMGATLDYSTFLKYYELMFQIAEKYSDVIQIAFKPHPILRAKLNLDAVWGIERTNEYYARWADLPNGQLEEGEYIDLFLESDVMILDSASFIIEYLCTWKPSLFLMNCERMKENFNTVGIMALKTMNIGYSDDDIYEFIETVVIGNEDSYSEKRIEFLKNEILPPHNRTASENIFYQLINDIGVHPE